MKNQLKWMWIAGGLLLLVILTLIFSPETFFGREIQGTSHEVPALKPSTELQLILLSLKC